MLLFLVCAIGTLTPPSPAQAWDDFGHRIIARIAWERLSDEARERAIALLAQAPEEAHVTAAAAPVRWFPNRELFVAASVWADDIKAGSPYNQPTWHFVNLSWETLANGKTRDRADRVLPREHLLERLAVLSDLLADPARPESERALDLAWLIHLVGDVHQPLHVSNRLTASEPEGDRGGNLFPLHTPPDALQPMPLHAWWDRLLSFRFPRRQGETERERVERAADGITRRHSFPELRSRLAAGDFWGWGKESLALAQTVVYAPPLERGWAPPEAYFDRSWRAIEPAIALAGYRLAELLERRLRVTPTPPAE
ncbi:MAG TPA: S1/P1 nuclease [Thermoanaerobaculia bacterium]|nr:S1/P1 nuclease [Thermoanaerobaculia bacterium]